MNFLFKNILLTIAIIALAWLCQPAKGNPIANPADTKDAFSNGSDNTIVPNLLLNSTEYSLSTNEMGLNSTENRLSTNEMGLNFTEKILSTTEVALYLAEDSLNSTDIADEDPESKIYYQTPLFLYAKTIFVLTLEVTGIVIISRALQLDSIFWQNAEEKRRQRNELRIRNENLPHVDARMDEGTFKRILGSTEDLSY